VPVTHVMSAGGCLQSDAGHHHSGNQIRNSSSGNVVSVHRRSTVNVKLV